MILNEWSGDEWTAQMRGRLNVMQTHGVHGETDAARFLALCSGLDMTPREAFRLLRKAKQAKSKSRTRSRRK
jgi:hypothetical protein